MIILSKYTPNGGYAMITIEKTKVMNLEAAVRGMRNPMNSWENSDSYYNENGEYVLGEADIKRAHALSVSGSDHRKYLRMIFVRSKPSKKADTLTGAVGATGPQVLYLVAI